MTIMWQNTDNDLEHNVQIIDYTHLQIVRDVPSYSTIDHFAVSPQVYNAVR